MDSQFSIASALLFGTICAAVDPVAVSRYKEKYREILILLPCGIEQY